MALRSFRELRVWQLGMEMVEEVYKITRGFPRHEAYGLGGQMQRAAVSIPSNVAEGYARQHRKEYLQHLSVSRASLAELATQIEIAARLDYVSPDKVARVLEKVESLDKQLYTLRNRLSKSKSDDA